MSNAAHNHHLVNSLLAGNGLPATGETPDLVPPRAIAAVNIVKEFDTEHGRRRVLDGISFKVHMGERIAILGRNGAGKSTLIQILSGLQRPTSGHVDRGLRMSWPLAFAGGFEGDLTGYDNIRFISRVYNAPFREVFDYVDSFAELGRLLYEPMRFYSSGMKMRIGFALSLAINFDCILIDEVILVGDRHFQEKCVRELFEYRKHCAMIIATHGMDVVTQYCSQALVMKNGRGRVFTDLDMAVKIYSSL
ncbi:ABC transporter ATP-binding protein [Lichenihabitans sp. PAMC28606]|uniref:ABC transporter ATP-binding protein n=1 Tax=Lichenihabitans sp. PAMC28606 TaxID=2880932 RepID=UPI001D09F005|nr:ABC transporter ATP-binding protein [Lichenihabitans sp. PAMC28606]UDL93943.1 ABC transporter ATP-binding protein [Lichenihabitans sp. PAMC28606]